MSRLLRVTLKGDAASPGRIPAADIAQLILGVERAMARGCGHVLGRPVKPTGRWGSVIEQAVDLRFVAYETGSLVHVFEIPSPPEAIDSLQLEGSTLGELGSQIALSALGPSALDYADVAQVWIDLANEISIGSRHDQVELVQELDEGTRTAVLDASSRHAMERVLEALPLFALRHDQLVGVLVEADFEAMTARLRTASGDRIQVSFDPGLADDVQLALRHQASLLGEVRYNTETAAALSVRVRSVAAGEQLPIGLFVPAADHQTIKELATRQGTKPPRSVDEMPYLKLARDELRAALEALES